MRPFIICQLAMIIAISSFAQIRQEGEKERQLLAIVVGIDSYIDWDSLKSPVRDSRAIGNDLEEFYGYEVALMENVKLEEFKSKVLEMASNDFDQGDQIFVFFSGRGILVDNEPALLFSDSRKVDGGYKHYLTYIELSRILEQSSCKSAMVILDSGLGEYFHPEDKNVNASNRNARTEQGGQGGIASRDEFIERKLYGMSRNFIISGGIDHQDPLPPKVHSSFTLQILEAFRNYGGTDGIVTQAELRGYLEVLDVRPFTGRFGSSNPSSEYIFILK